MELEFVTYNYLGVAFSSSGVFLKNTEIAVANANVGAVISTWGKARVVSWKANAKLNEAISVSSILYAVQVWGLRNCAHLEKVQLNKRFLTLNRNTPNFKVRLEAGTFHVSFIVLKMALKWLVQSLEMPEFRYPKLTSNNINSIIKKFSAIQFTSSTLGFSVM